MNTINNSDTFNGGEMKSKEPLVIYTPPIIKCQEHGEHAHVMTSDIKGHEGYWCMICMIEALERIGINKSERINE